MLRSLWLDTASSEVLVWSGSSDYFDKEAGAIDFIQQPRSSRQHPETVYLCTSAGQG